MMSQGISKGWHKSEHRQCVFPAQEVTREAGALSLSLLSLSPPFLLVQPRLTYKSFNRSQRVLPVSLTRSEPLVSGLPAPITARHREGGREGEGRGGGGEEEEGRRGRDQHAGPETVAAAGGESSEQGGGRMRGEDG